MGNACQKQTAVVVPATLAVVQLFWDLDSIFLPSNGLDAALQDIQKVHHTVLGFPLAADCKLHIVSNSTTNGRITPKDRLTLQRAGLSVTVTADVKEAVDREIEKNISDLTLAFVKDKAAGKQSKLVLGVISNDEDFATRLAKAKQEGIHTLYISSSAALTGKANVQQASSKTVDWGTLCPAPPAPPVPRPDTDLEAPGGEAFPPMQGPPSTVGKATVRCSVPGCTSDPFRLPPTYKGDPRKGKCPSCRHSSAKANSGRAPEPQSPSMAPLPATTTPISSSSSSSPARTPGKGALVHCSTAGCDSPPFRVPKGFKGKNPMCSKHRKTSTPAKS